MSTTKCVWLFCLAALSISLAVPISIETSPIPEGEPSGLGSMLELVWIGLIRFTFRLFGGSTFLDRKTAEKSNTETGGEPSSVEELDDEVWSANGN